MLSKSLSYGGLVTISILALAYFCADKVTLERFGEAVSERLCEAKRGSVDHEPQQRSSLPEELTPIKNVSKGIYKNTRLTLKVEGYHFQTSH